MRHSVNLPPTPDVRDEQAKEPNIQEIINTKLIESGEKERLMELLRERPTDSGWKDEMKSPGRFMSTEHMVSVTAEKPRLGNREWSLVGAHSKYKRHGVSAIRDFPPGCGPNAMLTGPKMNEEVSCGITGVGSGQMVGGLPEVEVEENVVDEQKDEEIACSDRVENSELMDLEHGGVNNLGQDAPLQELNVETCKSSQDVPSKSLVGELLHETHNASEDSTLVVANAISTECLDFKGKPKALDAENVVEQTCGETCSRPHYPIPSNLVWKERKYPPRRRISAIRDFPPGCGPNVAGNVVIDGLKVAIQVDKHLSGANREAENCDDIVRSVVNDVREHFKDGDALHSETNDYVYEETNDHLEAEFKFSKVSPSEMIVTPIQINRASADTEPRRKTEGSNHKLVDSTSRKPGSSTKGERDENLEDILHQKKEAYTKDKKIKRKLTSISGSDTLLQAHRMAIVDDLKDAVVVQGLMAAPSSPWRPGRVAAKSIPAASSRKGNRAKMGNSTRNKISKLMVSEKQDDIENSRWKLVENISLVTEKDAHEGAGQLVLGDEMDSSEDDDEKRNSFQLVSRSHNYNLSLPPSGATSSSDKGSRRQVRETLRLFQAVVRKLTQEEESKRKGKGTTGTRVDQIASKILKDGGKYVNTGKPIIGPVPGVEVGDEFHYRVELMIVGLHRPSMAGIDSVKKGQMLLATSIVASGRYDNEVENSDVLIYAGQGGTKTGDKEPEDQKLERGNLALKNSIDEKNYVRVIRGYREMKSSDNADVRGKMVATYTYDGLYTVEHYWPEVGPYGKIIFKFELKRLPGQPELAWKEVKKSNKFKERPGRCVDDITGGKEAFPISAVNTIDNEKPPAFTYIRKMIFPDWYSPVLPKGCDCVSGCSDSAQKCACIVKNGGEIPYNCNGAIVEAKSLVYECGPSCKCPSACHNRVGQHGIKFQLEIFKTESRGWGVRSLSSIPSGSFICEYIGELLEDKEAEQRTGNDEYLFDIGQNYDDQGLRDGVSTLMPDSSAASSSGVVEEGYTIDAAKYGNVARFINHSCNPNLYAQNVLYDNDDKRFPHIMLFAAENIPPLQELTYHYNYTIDQVRDVNGNIKVKNCYCGSSDCTGRMY
ncbi:hypothetical protein Dimus_013161 [Dionaea muscipula]